MFTPLAQVAALLALLLASNNVAAGPCDGLLTQTTCTANAACQWFLDECIDLPAKDCKSIKKQDKCTAVPGCYYFTQPQWWVPAQYAHTHYGNFAAPKIGCDAKTMCNRLPASVYCNQFSHCTWVDGACKVAGTPPADGWQADCTRHLAWRTLDCTDLGPQCTFLNLKACDTNGRHCEQVKYGCRNANWCDVDKGPYLQDQCARMSTKCSWENNQCVQRPTPAPTPAPTMAPTEQPSMAPTTSSPTDSPTNTPTNLPTQKPTTGSPTKKPTTPVPTNPPTFDPTNKPTTLTPTKLPTALPTAKPTTLTPTMAVTKTPTAAPTICTQTMAAGSFVCTNQPFAELTQTFTVPAGEAFENYCMTKCKDGAAQGSYGVEVFPGCRAWTFDGTKCKLFGCYPGGTGVYTALVSASTTTTYGVPSSQCFPAPTLAPTTTCTYTNSGDPPAQMADKKPFLAGCVLNTSPITSNFVGSIRDKLNWCETACTNTFGSACVATEFEGGLAGIAAQCVFAKCQGISSTAGQRVIYRAIKGACQ